MTQAAGEDIARPLPSAQGEHPEGGLVHLLTILGGHKRMLVLWPLAAASVAAVISLVVPKTYTATTRILPPQQATSTAAAMLSQLGSLASLAGASSGLKNPIDLYAGMLKSDSVTHALVERFGLLAVYGENLRVDAVRTLDKRTRVLPGRNGLITIEVDARTPELAADLANGYVDELFKLTSRLAVTEAAQRRVFFERQLQQTKEKLAETEVRLRQAIDTGGLISVDVQGRAAVETVARLRASITAKLVQLGGMRSFATPDNPDLRRAEQELASLRQELAKLEGASPTSAGSEAAPISPSGLTNIRLLRDLKYYEALFEVLVKQYESARIDESREAPLVQVVDRATPPERRSAPRRTMIVMLAFFCALAAAVAAALAAHELERWRADPVLHERLGRLRAAWRRHGVA